MARKMTPEQVIVVNRLVQGWPLDLAPFDQDEVPQQYIKVLGSHHCMDGRLVRMHRTIKTDTPAGSQTQSFRVHPDGSLERKL